MQILLSPPQSAFYEFAYHFTDAKMQHNLLLMNTSDVENEITNFE